MPVWLRQEVQALPRNHRLTRVGITPQRVVAAALIDAQGRVLIAERPAGKWQAGRWEFPGGKVEPDESEEAAVRRELHEELGVQVQDLRRLTEVRHDYGDRAVALALWLVLRYEGDPRGWKGSRCDGQPWRILPEPTFWRPICR